MRKTLAMLLFGLFILCIYATTTAYAVPRPDAIQWRAAPQPFIRSLYVGVLGRQPENNRVVVEWSRQVNWTAASRKRVFWLFVNSREYQSSRWARLRKQYNVYYKWQQRGRKWVRTWWVAKRPSSAKYYYHAGPFTFGVAMALRNFHEAWERR